LHSQSNRNRGAEAAGRRESGRTFGHQTESDDFVLGGSIGRGANRPDKRSMYGSLFVHVGLVAAVLIGTFLQRPDLPEFDTFTVQIWSPPPQVEGPPQPEPPPPEVQPAIVAEPIVEAPKPTPREIPKPAEQTPVERPVEKPPPEPEPVTGNAPDPESTGGDNIDIDQIGEEFPFPGYLENIIRQVNRHFRGWSGDGTPSAQIAFYINRDGTIGGLTLVEKSPDFKFNLQTMSAVELAGRNKAFGELPEEWASDRLWVRFRFIPPGR
jgi:outer membrane biosynthesis protein TonB